MRKLVKIILIRIGLLADDIKIFWSSNKYIEGKEWDNFGDGLVPHLIQKISGKKIKWVKKDAKVSNFFRREKVYFTIGSILDHSSKNNIVWGSGIMHSNSRIKKSKFLAVRGPISYSRVLASGQKMAKIWGDPALLCPFYYPVPKQTYRNVTSLVPHYTDYEFVTGKFQSSAEIIDLRDSDITSIIGKIATSKMVFSSSLHGLIIAHAYGVKAVWVVFTNDLEGDDIKFFDYFMSVGIKLYKPFIFENDLIDYHFDESISLPDLKLLNNVQMNLLKSCPFLKK